MGPPEVQAIFFGLVQEFESVLETVIVDFVRARVRLREFHTGIR
jgi:hypothetical protein